MTSPVGSMLELVLQFPLPPRSSTPKCGLFDCVYYLCISVAAFQQLSSIWGYGMSHSAIPVSCPRGPILVSPFGDYRFLPHHLQFFFQ